MNDTHVRQQLVNMLVKQQAHQLFDDVVKNFPSAYYNTYPPNTPYTFWHLIEHIRLAQYDILDYIENPDYQYRPFPEGYWPAKDAQADEAAWKATIAAFRADLGALVNIVNDPQRDLYAQIPHGEKGHTILREINIIATHNAYHVGEMGILRAVLNLW